MHIKTAEVIKAYTDCRKNKRNSKAAIEFESDLANNIRSITEDLNTGKYQIGTSLCFGVPYPKPREVWAGSFRDRVVHHVSFNRIGDRFIRSFSEGSCACIAGRGTLYGSKRLEKIILSGTESWSKELYCLSMDISNFFVSIQKDIVFDQLKKKICSSWDLDLAGQILYHDPTQDYIISGGLENLIKVPPHKSLFNTPPFMGLAIGNQSSQFNANVKMNMLDMFVEHKIKPYGYVRYVDDFILVDHSIEKLKEAKDRIEQFLWESMILTANPSKTKLNSAYNGVDFVGRVIRPWRTTPRSTLRKNAINKIRKRESTAEGLTSTLGLMRQSKSYNTRKSLCRIALKAGYSVNAEATKVYGHAR